MAPGESFALRQNRRELIMDAANGPSSPQARFFSRNRRRFMKASVLSELRINPIVMRYSAILIKLSSKFLESKESLRVGISKMISRKLSTYSSSRPVTSHTSCQPQWFLW